jgi:hypothetical protein
MDRRCARERPRDKDRTALVKRAVWPSLLNVRWLLERLHACRLDSPVRGAARDSSFALPQHPDEHRPERPVLLPLDQELGEGAAPRIAPELADPLGALEVPEA